MKGSVTLEYRPNLIHCKKCNELVEMQHYFKGFSNYCECPKCGFTEKTDISTETKTVLL